MGLLRGRGLLRNAPVKLGVVRGVGRIAADGNRSAAMEVNRRSGEYGRRKRL